MRPGYNILRLCHSSLEEPFHIQTLSQKFTIYYGKNDRREQILSITPDKRIELGREVEINRKEINILDERLSLLLSSQINNNKTIEELLAQKDNYDPLFIQNLSELNQEKQKRLVKETELSSTNSHYDNYHNYNFASHLLPSHWAVGIGIYVFMSFAGYVISVPAMALGLPAILLIGRSTKKKV